MLASLKEINPKVISGAVIGLATLSAIFLWVAVGTPRWFSLEVSSEVRGVSYSTEQYMGLFEVCLKSANADSAACSSITFSDQICPDGSKGMTEKQVAGAIRSTRGMVILASFSCVAAAGLAGAGLVLQKYLPLVKKGVLASAVASVVFSTIGAIVGGVYFGQKFWCDGDPCAAASASADCTWTLGYSFGLLCAAWLLSILLCGASLLLPDDSKEVKNLDS